MNKTAIQYYPWLIWGLGAAYFFFEYFARVSPAVMVDHLMLAFHVDALSLGALSAFFYYAYVGMQIPVGVLVDRFGARVLLTITPILCGASCLLFASTEQLWVAELSRFIMGFSAAFAFVGALKLASMCFSGKRFGLIAGLTQALGMLGAAMGEGPLSVMVSHLGWRHSLMCIGALLIALGVLIGLVARKRPVAVTQSLPAHASIRTSLKSVLRNKQSWYNGLFVGFLYAPTAAFAELWGVSYLSATYHLSVEVSASAVSMIFLGWGFGGPLAGWLSDLIGRRKPLFYGSACLSFLWMTLVLYLPGNTSYITLFLLLFAYGISNAGVAVSYALSSEINQRAVAGTSMAFANMASVLIGALLQPFIGWMLGVGTIKAGIHVYSTQDYHVAMIVLPVCLLLALFFARFVKETYCQSVVADIESKGCA